jgi:pimeloyl-ACP methyl ester carboxylesterase
MQRVSSSDGVAVAVHHLGGSPGGQRVLFSHATGFHARCYTAIAHALGDRFECYGLDYRGHGETPAPDGWKVDWAAFGADATSVATHLAPREGLIGIGHSMGGAALLMAAARHPGLFEQLLLFEPIAFPSDHVSVEMNEHPIVTGARRRRNRFASRDEACANYASKPPLSIMAHSTLRAYVDHGFRDADDGDGGVVLCCPPDIEADVFIGSQTNGVWELLPAVEVPTMVVAGAVAELEPSGRARAIAARLPHGTFLELPHLSHFGPFSHPGEIAGLIAAPV